MWSSSWGASMSSLARPQPQQYDIVSLQALFPSTTELMWVGHFSLYQSSDGQTGTGRQVLPKSPSLRWQLSAVARELMVPLVASQTRTEKYHLLPRVRLLGAREAAAELVKKSSLLLEGRETSKQGWVWQCWEQSKWHKGRGIHSGAREENQGNLCTEAAPLREDSSGKSCGHLAAMETEYTNKSEWTAHNYDTSN